MISLEAVIPAGAISLSFILELRWCYQNSFLKLVFKTAFHSAPFLSGVDSNLIHYSVLIPAQFSVCALEYVQYVFSNITSIPPCYYLLMRKSESFPTLD